MATVNDWRALGALSTGLTDTTLKAIGALVDVQTDNSTPEALGALAVAEWDIPRSLARASPRVDELQFGHC